MFEDSARVFACLEAGATGYILKDEMPSGIVGSVRILVAGGSPISPSIARRLLSRFAKSRQPGRVAAEVLGPGEQTQSDQVLSARELFEARGLGLLRG